MTSITATEWRLGWDGNPVFWDTVIYVTRDRALTPEGAVVTNGGVSADWGVGIDTSAVWQVRQAGSAEWIGIITNSQIGAAFIGDGYQVELTGKYGANVETARSEPFYFGSHPAPMVTATVLNSTDVRVNWQSTANVTRGGSQVTWEVTAYKAGTSPPENQVQETLTPIAEALAAANLSHSHMLTLDSSIRTWTITVRGRNAYGWGLVGETELLLDPGHIELSLELPTGVTAPFTRHDEDGNLHHLEMSDGDLSSLTLKATVKLVDTGGNLGNATAYTINISIDAASTATPGDGDATWTGGEDYEIRPPPTGTVLATLTIPANASHDQTATTTFTGLTIRDDGKAEHAETIIFRGTLMDASDVVVDNVEVRDATFIIVSPAAPPKGPPCAFRGSDSICPQGQRYVEMQVETNHPEAPANHWRIGWEDMSAHLTGVSYDLDLERIDGGVPSDDAVTARRVTQTRTDPWWDVPLVVAPADNSWDGAQFIDGQGFRITVQPFHHHAIFGANTPTERAQINFGSYAAPTVTVTHAPGSPRILVHWRMNGNRDARSTGRINVDWMIHVTAVANATVTHRRRIGDLGLERAAEEEFTVPNLLNFPVWRVTVRSHADPNTDFARWGPAGQTTVTVNPASPGPKDVTVTVRGDRQVRVRWAAPADAAINPISAYRVQRWSETAGQWVSLGIPIAMDGDMFVAEDRAVSGARQRVHTYRVLAVRSPVGPGRDEVIAASAATTDPTAAVPFVPATLDLNLDGHVTALDAVVLYHHLMVPSLSAGEPEGSNRRRNLLSRLTLDTSQVPDDEALRNWLARAGRWVELEGNLLDADFDNFGSPDRVGITANDAIILYYALEFGQLLGNGSADSGLAGVRNRLIGARLGDIRSSQVQERARQVMAKVRHLPR